MKKFLTVLAFGLMSSFILVSGANVAAGTIDPGTGGGSNLGEGSVGVCTFIGPICDALGIRTGNAGETAATTVRTWVNLGITILFIGIILLAVFIIVQAAIKYIQSQGDEGKIAEAQKAIKSVFIGIALLFVGIIGIVLVLAFFSATNLLGGGSGNECEQCVLNCVATGQGVTTCQRGTCSGVCDIE